MDNFVSLEKKKGEMLSTKKLRIFQAFLIYLCSKEKLILIVLVRVVKLYYYNSEIICCHRRKDGPSRVFKCRNNRSKIISKELSPSRNYSHLLWKAFFCFCLIDWLVAFTRENIRSICFDMQAREGNATLKRIVHMQESSM